MRDPDRRLLVLGRPAPPAPRFRPGQRVRIRSGPFAGTLGEINRLRLAHLRATVEFVVGGQRTEQEVNFEEIEPLR